MHTDWPAWKKGLALRARHLAGMEDYLLAGHRFLGLDPGLERFHSDKSVRLQDNKILVQNLSGLTPAGEPVLVGDADGETLTSDALGNDCFDLFVRNASPSDGAPSPSQLGTKLNLHVCPCHAKGAPPLRKDHQHRLYVGRWQLRGSSIELLNKPLPRRLDALYSLADWESWVKPVRDQIEAQLLARLSSSAVTRDPLELGVMALLVTLAVDWATLPLGQLAEAFVRVGRYRHLISEHGHLPAPPLPQAYRVPESLEATEIPARLLEYMQTKEGRRDSTLMLEGREYSVDRNSGPGTWKVKFNGDTRPASLLIGNIGAPEFPPKINIWGGRVKEAFKMVHDRTEAEFRTGGINETYRSVQEWYIEFTHQVPKEATLALFREQKGNYEHR